MALSFFGLGALLGADQTAGPQLMGSQPLVAGFLGGLLVGEAQLGILIGIVGQLAWNGAVPVGSLPNPDVSGGTLAGVLAAHQLEGSLSHDRAAVAGMMVALLAGWAGSSVILLNRRLNMRWTPWVLRAQGKERLERTRWAQMLGWAGTAAISGTWVLAAAAAAAAAAPLASKVLPHSPVGAPVHWPVLWGLGLAAALLAFWKESRKDWMWLAGGAAAAVLARRMGAF